MMGDQWIGVKKGEKLSLKEVVIMHIKGISELSRKEFTPSFWSKKPMKIGDGVAMVETYHEDKRLAYINSVDFLLDLMLPYADDQFNEELEGLENNEKNEYEAYQKSGGTEEEWAWKKLKFRRTLFRKIMLMIHRIKFFEYIPFVDYGHEEDDEEEEE